MAPFVSIIIPVYNTGNFLHETIQSVINQTYPNWELFLIDDGSTDNSAEICKSYVEQDDRINYHYKTNGGQASARNLGINKSHGEWIAFLDSDDIWLPQKLAHQIKEIELYDADFFYSLGYYYYPEKEKQLETYDWVTGEQKGLDFFKTLYHSCAVNTNTVLVKKKLLDQVGYFNEAQIVRGSEDWDLWMRIALKANSIFGSKNRDVYYRIHPGGIHLQHVRMFKGKVFVYEQYDNHPDISNAQRLKQYRYVFRELMNYLAEENRLDEIPIVFEKFKKKDQWGWGTLKQRFLIKVLPLKSFIMVSNKLVYRFAYRLEQLFYRLSKQ